MAVTFNLRTGALDLFAGKCQAFNENIQHLLCLSGKQSAFVTRGLIQHLIGGVGIVGNVWTDQSGNGNNGILKNSPTINSDNVELDGISSYVDVVPPSLSGDYSIEITSEVRSSVHYDALFVTWDNGTRDTLHVTDYYNTREVLFQKKAGNTFFANVNDNVVVHRLYTFSNMEFNYYENGVLLCSKPLSSPSELEEAYIGAGWIGYPNISGGKLDGFIYGWKLYNVTLTQVEATQIYNLL